MSGFRLTPAALESLRGIGRYTKEKWGAAQRDLYLRALDVRFHDLAENPEKGKIREELAQGLRSFPEGRHVIYYLVAKRYIVIVDILHERMDSKARLSSNLHT